MGDPDIDLIGTFCIVKLVILIAVPVFSKFNRNILYCKDVILNTLKDLDNIFNRNILYCKDISFNSITSVVCI